MFIGGGSNKPSLQRIRAIKVCLQEALDLPEDAIITVTQLACLEKDCSPLETVIGLPRDGKPQPQGKIHKATEAVMPSDLQKVCADWGYTINISNFKLSTASIT